MSRREPGSRVAVPMAIGYASRTRYLVGLVLLATLATPADAREPAAGVAAAATCGAVVGPDHRVLVPASALFGAAFLVLADTAARIAFLGLGTEPPVGAITAFVGGPLFLWLLRRTERRA